MQHRIIVHICKTLQRASKGVVLAASKSLPDELLSAYRARIIGHHIIGGKEFGKREKGQEKSET